MGQSTAEHEGTASATDLTISSTADVVLSATLWLPPASGPHPGIVMVGGSGPTDRHNDVFFPPIREHLLAAGIAVLSYDKRGVGASTGSWLTSDYADLAADATAALRTLRSHPAISSVGLFGHSEGAWVVLKAAATATDQTPAYVITNSGSALPPGAQERYATESAMRLAGAPETDIDLALSCHDRVIEALHARTALADALPSLTEHPGYPIMFADGEAPSEPMWGFMTNSVRHDPMPDVDAITCPHLALFGADDPVVPAAVGVASFAASAARRGRASFTAEVFPDAGHRIGFEKGDGAFADGYLDALTDWILARAR